MFLKLGNMFVAVEHIVFVVITEQYGIEKASIYTDATLDSDVLSVTSDPDEIQKIKHWLTTHTYG